MKIDLVRLIAGRNGVKKTKHIYQVQYYAATILTHDNMEMEWGSQGSMRSCVPGR